VSLLVSGMGALNYLMGSLTSGGWRFTNMSTLLILAGMVMFLMGLLAEQLTNLQYKDAVEDEN
jgi:hypothetical protein